MPEQNLEPVYDVDAWKYNDWHQVDYCRVRRTELWIFEAEASSDNRERGDRMMAYVVKKGVDNVFHVYSRLRDAVGAMSSETSYMDCALEPDEFVEGIAGFFDVPYDFRTPEQQKNPPKEEACRQIPVKDSEES